MNPKEIVIVINPGSTSTKIALYNRSELINEHIIRHSQKELDQFHKVTDQFEYRYQMVEAGLDKMLSEKDVIVVGIVGRGGIVKPLEGGTYTISNSFLEDARTGSFGDHASNLGSMLADKLAKHFNLDESFTVDPVSAGNIWEKARISGVPGIERNRRGHPLNMKMTARKIAKQQNIPFEEAKYVIAHLGGGISIAAVDGGKIADVNDALMGMGPFSPNRAGALPTRGVMDLCYSMPRKEVETLLSKNSGLKAYLGVDDLRDVFKLIDEGNEKAQLIYDAFVYQIAKEIGAYHVALKCKANGIIITGGIAYSERFISDLKEYVSDLTDFFVYPGENEMEALAEGAFRVIDGIESALKY
ncbi:butyrate kinase [Labilibaculum sp. A4]|uniref:butyrate kinase n=1 Tax=Labilibaculum euxinus TaxID=2686357 RepID=UPI000F622913|nr:butyrate kinase [Labilibaculum euxinus]MDQ1771622.1 butyrate kinase [Labilibaculum euxinus]MWN78531.1 butyrate kinase [Labilibaculum euxinus]